MKIRSLMLAALTLVPFTALANQPSDSANQQFAELMQKELTNRATARKAADIFRNQKTEGGQAEFWSSYYKLEEVTLSVYTPVADSLHIEANNFMAGVKGYSAAAYQWIAPQSFVGTLLTGTSKYYEELKSSKSSIPPDYAAFFDYVLDQEEAQVKALVLAQKNDYQGAKSIMDTFVACATKKKVSLEAECSPDTLSSNN